MSAAGDILDNELRILIDSARARGINVVTIFDSCNSGTATRDPTFDSGMIRNRGAPALRVKNPIEPNVKTVTAMARSASAGNAVASKPMWRTMRLCAKPRPRS